VIVSGVSGLMIFAGIPTRAVLQVSRFSRFEMLVDCYRLLSQAHTKDLPQQKFEPHERM